MFYGLSEITLFIKGVENLVDTVQSSNLLLIHVHYFIGAVTRYYETKRQQFLDSLPHRKDAAEKRVLERKLTSRRRRVSISCFCLFTPLLNNVVITKCLGQVV